VRDLAILTFVTLDGVMQAPSMREEDQSNGFDKGGWAAPYWEGVMEQVRREAMATSYDMLFGRKTYDLFSAHWPDVEESPIATMMNSARKYVVTSDRSELTWSNSQAVSGDIDQEVTRLKSANGPLLQVHGSWELIQFLLARDLIDEFRIWTFPVVTGSGKRLFEQGSQSKMLSLVKSEASANGAVMNIYRRQ
jgi:dihydrofolate reductase